MLSFQKFPDNVGILNSKFPDCSLVRMTLTWFMHHFQDSCHEENMQVSANASTKVNKVKEIIRSNDPRQVQDWLVSCKILYP